MADVGDCGKVAAADTSRRDVDAGSGKKHGVGSRTEIDGRETDGAPHLMAAHYAAADAEGMAEEMIGLLHVAVGNKSANGGRGDVLLGGELLGKDNFYAEFASVALVVFEALRLSRIRAAKVMIVADKKMRDAVAVAEILLHEVAGAESGYFCGEIEENHLINAANGFKEIALLCVGGEELRGIRPPQHALGMPLEGKDERGGFAGRLPGKNGRRVFGMRQSLCQLFQLLAEILMTAMDTVKKTNGGDFFQLKINN